MNATNMPTANYRVRELLTMSALVADNETLALELGADWETPAGYMETETMLQECKDRLCELDNVQPWRLNAARADKSYNVCGPSSLRAVNVVRGDYGHKPMAQTWSIGQGLPKVSKETMARMKRQRKGPRDWSMGASIRKAEKTVDQAAYYIRWEGENRKKVKGKSPMSSWFYSHPVKRAQVTYSVCREYMALSDSEQKAEFRAARGIHG